MSRFPEGLEHLSRGRWAEAIACFDAVLAEEPAHHRAHNNRGVALHNLHRDDEALEAYTQALRIAPDYAHAWCNRGNALTSLRRFPEALAAYAEALRCEPRMMAAYDNRGGVRMLLGDYEGAAADFEALLALAPTHPLVKANLLLARLHLCDWRDYDVLKRNVSEVIHNDPFASPPFASLVILDNAADQARLAQLWAERYFPEQTPLAASLPPSRLETDAPIRVAYLSADFHAHPTAYLAIELFERHDRARFETIALSYGPETGDPMRTRLKAAFDRFIDVSALSDRDIAAMLAELGVDIAVDLKGYTTEGRPGILAHRGAPVQVSFLGFPGTLGAPYVDYIIADGVIAPPDAAPFYREHIVRLPHCYQPNSARPSLPTPSRQSLGLPNDGVVFASFNNPFKLTPDMFAAWTRLLRLTPRAVLWLYAPAAAAANLRKEAEAAGIDPARLIFAPHAPHAEHLARLAAADIFLDTAPYNAHTTASDALWAGVPVVTMLGQTFAGRVAASLCAAAGASELATPNLEEYQALAHDPDALRAMKARLARSAPLFDIATYTRDLERAYAIMFERAARGELPSEINL